MPASSPDDAPGNALHRGRSLLLILPGLDEEAEAIQALAERFFGAVVRGLDALAEAPMGARVYACGDLSGLGPAPEGVTLLAVRGLSTGAALPLVEPGALPLSVHGLGVLLPRLFGEEALFEQIQGEHAFQHLTESSKPSHALRTGIYLSAVRPGAADALRFHLMRCSSNLTGPTDNFRAGDQRVISALNAVAASVFERPPPLNHVLAQLYPSARAPSGKARKAKIGAHSDKTKDMHDDAVMAFCSFYPRAELAGLDPSPQDPYDLVKGRCSGLARLVFKRKRGLEGSGLVPEFSVTLYPNSVFFIPLSTNRRYTHELRPSALDVERAPTRMGYVVRCSAREAEHRGGQTFLLEGGAWVPLQPIDAAGARDLRAWYFQENTSDAEVPYGAVHFSMNAGDYMRPIL